MPNFKILLDFFNSGLFLSLQIIGGVLSLIFLTAIIILIKKGAAFDRHVKHLWIAWNATPIPRHRIGKRWIGIRKAMDTEDPENWRAAILDADLMLDEVLAKIGYAGDNINQRLENILPEQFPSLEDAWRAHRVRDFLAEDLSYPLSRKVAETTMEIYKTIFLETGLIL
jgi:hypothetical protein